MFGLPDLGLTGLKDVVEELSRIKAVSKLPILVDIDTGFGSVLNIKKTAIELYKVGAAGLQIEDQTFAKRCGHLNGKNLVSIKEMVARLTAIREVLSSSEITLVARTDAFGVENSEQLLKRALAYEAAGADVLFLEAVNNLEVYQFFCQKLTIPVLANITEFGKTPLFDYEALKKVGVGAILYPLSIFRIMNKAAMEGYQQILKTGSQKNLLPIMQTRDALYDLIDYHRQEKELDAFYAGIEQGE
jgi:methylisocitrate lyase